MTDLIVMPEEKNQLLSVFIEARDFTPEIEKIRTMAKDLPVDMSVKKNRDEVASFAYKVAKSKTAVEKAGAALSAEYKEIPKKIDATRRAYKEAFESLQVEVRQPLTEWEAVEAQRVARLEETIQWIKSFNDQSADTHESTGLKISLELINELVVNESLEEYETEAHRVKAASIKHLEEQIVIAEKREAEQAELESLRKAAAEQAKKDREAQIARDAAENARKEAEQAAQAEREKHERERIAAEMVAEQAKRDLELAEQRRIAQENQAKLDAIEAEKRAAEQADAARQAEIDRQAAEAKRIEDGRLKREADTKHKGAINRQALADLVEHADITEEQAKLVIKCIAKRLIANVTINY